MLNTFIVVFRESFEAILIVGILHTFLEKQRVPRAKRFLFAGASFGLLLSFMFALSLWKIESLMEGSFLDFFQMTVLGLAVALIVHMCLWMNRHAHTIRLELEQGAKTALEKNEMHTIFLLAAVSILREGFETVIFLYGNFLESLDENKIILFFTSIFLGVAAGFIFWLLLKLGLKKLKLRTFFKVTTGFLLVTAGGLLLRLIQQMMMKGWLPPLKENIWDTSALFSGDSIVGGVFVNITGYQPSPALISVLFYLFYWLIIYYLFSRRPAKAPVS